MQQSATPIDCLVHNVGELATPQGTESRGGKALASIHVQDDAAIAIQDGVILEIGSEADLAARYLAKQSIDAQGNLVIPGLVDAHTHPVFLGTREGEFEDRILGKSYLEISEGGGGIVSSMLGVRNSSKEQLVQALLMRMDRFLVCGTTTVEAKSGYGLSLADEMKSLEAIAEANRMHPVDLVPTFLGAHDFPPEYRDNRPAYLKLLREEMLPAVAESGLAEYCDVFTESHVFGLDESRDLLNHAKELGLKVRLHVDQLTQLGGAQLAAELGAASADHLEHVSDEGIDALGQAGVIPVLCPLVPLFLRESQEAPGRRMADAGLSVALATDFNPGSCYAMSLFEVMSYGALRYGLLAGETLTAATINAAVSLGRGDSIGTLEPGKRADLVITDLPSHRHLTYDMARSPVQHVIKSGKLVYSASHVNRQEA